MSTALLLAVVTSLLLAPGVVYRHNVGFGTAAFSGIGVGAVSFVGYLILMTVALPAWLA